MLSLVLAAMALIGVGASVWLATAPQTRFHFGPRPEAAWQGIVRAVAQAVERQTAEPIRHAADALGWPPTRIATITVAVASMLFLFLVSISWWIAVIALPLLLFGSWRFAGSLVIRQYRVWQQEMVRGLPPLIAMLRVHLDLGRTVQDALLAVLPSVRDPLRRDLSRTLSDMSLASARRNEHGQSGAARDALKRLAERVSRLEFRTFTDTITQAWDARLSGEALAPLQDLLRITRERESEETTAKLDMVMTTAPGLALFGIMILVVAGWLLGSGGLGSL